MLSRVIRLLCIAQIYLLCTSLAFANEIITPDSWSYHVNSGKIMQTADGINVGGTDLYFSLTTRYKLRANDYAEDHDIYQYLKTSFDDIKVGTGTISGKLYFRVADDLNSDSRKQWSDSEYYFYNDILDKELNENDMAPRLYYGNLVFNDFINGGTLTLGRQYIDSLNTFHIDGASASYSYGDLFSLHLHGGASVSYFYENDNDYLYGGGVELKPLEDTSIQLEANQLEVEDMGDEMFSSKIAHSFSFGRIYARYDRVNETDLFEAATDVRFAQTQTALYLKYSGQLDKVKIKDSSYIVNPFTYSLMDSEKFNKYQIRMSQQIFNLLSVDIGGEFKQVSGNTNRYNREYNKYRLAVNIDEPFNGAFIRLIAEMMSMDNHSSSNEEKIRYGFRYSQIITEKVDLWAGVDHQNFVYDYDNDRYKDAVTVYYLGAEWTPLDFLSCSLDLSAENTEIYEDISDDFETNYTAEAYISLIF